MPEFRFDSYCGLYCGACDILSAYKKGLESGTLPQWNDLPSEFKNLPFNARKAEIKCLGCKTDTVFVGCSKCIIRSCAKEKTGIETCMDCNRYPCWRVKLTAFVRKILNLESKLPHLKDITHNTEVIRKIGLQFWLEEQNRKWQCPNCGKRLSWYRASCSDCNSNGIA
jgi:hypothetical protein